MRKVEAQTQKKWGPRGRDAWREGGLELNTDGSHAVWDGNLPNGTAAENWEAYVKQIRLASEFGGELGLTFYIGRPGQPTVQIGKGKAALWLLLQNRHYEPLSTSADKAALACRRAHAKPIERGYKWIPVETMRSVWHRQWQEDAWWRQEPGPCPELPWV